MTKKLYGHFTEEIVESPEMFAHQMAMTGENLRGKAEIAAELAWRDRRIAELEKDRERLEWLAQLRYYGSARAAKAQAKVAELEKALKAVLTFYGMDRDPGELSDLIHRQAEQALQQGGEQ